MRPRTPTLIRPNIIFHITACVFYTLIPQPVPNIYNISLINDLQVPVIIYLLFRIAIICFFPLLKIRRQETQLFTE